MNLRPEPKNGYTDRSRAVAQNFFLAFHPVQVNSTNLRPTYSFGFGLLGLYSLLIMFVSGLLLMFHYVPEINSAYASMVRLETDLFLGGLIKNLHVVSGHALVAFAALHLVRVFFTGAYAGRAANWILSVAMLLGAVLTVLTGYVLPWDQSAYWITAGGGEILAEGPIFGEWIRLLAFGSEDVSQATLTRFYTLHFIVGPLALMALAGWHVFLLRRGGPAATEWGP